MDRLVKITNKKDIFTHYKETPIGQLLEYHNLNRTFDQYDNAELLIGVCMDNRIKLRLPQNFAYVLRTGGANLRYHEFQVSYAIAVGGLKHIALIAHSQCAMVNLNARKDQFIEGLVKNSGWEKQWATDHYRHFAPMFEIGNEMDFILSEARRFRSRYPDILTAPLFYRVEDNHLYQLKE